MKITIFASRKETCGRIEEHSWDEMAGLLKVSRATAETAAQYQAWKQIKAAPDATEAQRREADAALATAKDCGGYIAGTLKDNIRKGGNVISRSCIVLDIDYPTAETYGNITALGLSCILHTTHSHTPGAPKYRLLIETNRDMEPLLEYPAAARKIAEKIGLDTVDKASFTRAQMMYWPSHSCDAQPYFAQIQGEPLNVDALLAEYDDYKNPLEWPGYEKAAAELKNKQEDPVTKTGVVGAFCRAYDIPAAVEKYLSDIYAPGSAENRLTYIAGSGADGVVLYKSESSDDYVLAYSMHATDPANDGHCKNAFDLVRVHKYGRLDNEKEQQKPVTERKSYKAMVKLALKDENVIKNQINDRTAGHRDFTSPVNGSTAWLTQLQINPQTQKVSPTADNLILIMDNDPGLQNIAYNLFSGHHTVTGPIAWDRTGRTEEWSDADDAQLYKYLVQTYGAQYTGPILNQIFTATMDDRRYDPLVKTVEELPDWDGTERIDRLFADYLAAEDNEYTREAARKFCVALIAKAMAPQDFRSKFDEMLVLLGPMGIGKSTLLRNIVGQEWFSDDLNLADMNSKDAAEKMQEYWLQEVGEMAGAAKADINRLKSFISRMSDNYRQAYGKHVMRHPRRCLIAATSNNLDGVLIDVTGNRKYWPIVCNTGAAKDPRDITPDITKQILAEAYCYWLLGEPLTLSDEAAKLAEDAQRRAMRHDDRAGLVEEYLETDLPVTWNQLSIPDRIKYVQDPKKARDDEPTKYYGSMQRDVVCPLEIHVELFGKSRWDFDVRQSRAISGILAEFTDKWERPGESKQYVPGYGRQRVWTRRDT